METRPLKNSCRFGGNDLEKPMFSRTRRVVMASLLCAIFVVNMAAANLAAFGGGSLVLNREEKEQRPPVYATWEYVLPGRPPVDGGAESWKRAAFFPRIPGAKIRIYGHSDPIYGRNEKEARFTSRMDTLLKDRSDMTMIPGKGWCYELVIGGKDRESEPLYERGIFNYRLDIKVNDVRRVRGYLGIENRLADGWFGVPVTFALYDPPRGGRRMTPREIEEIQSAKGSGNVSLLAPKALFVTPDGQVISDGAAGESRRERKRDDQVDPEPSDGPVSQRDGGSSERRVVFRLRGDNFTKCWIRLEAPDLYEFVELDSAETTLSLPRDIKAIKVYVVTGKDDKSGSYVGEADLSDPSPIIIRHRP